MLLVASVWKSSIGRKAVMAVTGVVLFGFVIGHMLGNLQIFIPDGGVKINAYGRMLHENPALLWGARIVLLGSVLAHIAAAVSLAAQNRAARPVPYVRRSWREASYASRTMMISGPLLALFVVYHLLHFTTGHAHPDPVHQPGSPAWDVHHNVLVGFANPWASLTYILAMIFLGQHLFHGGWSLFQSLGLNHPRWTPILRNATLAAAAVVTGGNISIPAAVLLGLIT